MRKWLPRAYGTHHNTASTARNDKNPTREFRRINPGPILLKIVYRIKVVGIFPCPGVVQTELGMIFMRSAAFQSYIYSKTLSRPARTASSRPYGPV